MLDERNPAVDYFLTALGNASIKEYQKTGRVTAQRAQISEKVDTVIDGLLETTNIAHPGDWILTGPMGERYVLDDAKFKARYRHLSDSLYEAVGTCWAVQYHGTPFTFKAPWGEDMICEDRDWICSTRLDGTDVYRIEKQAFARTYSPMPDSNTQH